MSKLITILTIAFLTGCYGSQLAQMRAEQQEQNRRMWARLDRQPTPDDGQRQQGGQPQTASVGMTGGQVSTGTMIARQKHGVYMGAVGEQPRQVTQGRKIQVTNLICDDDDRDGGLNCRDKDGNGAPDFNTWLSFSTVSGEPLICDTGFFHPDMHVSLLLPQQTCFVEIGATRTLRIAVSYYRNNGNPWSYLDLDTTPYKTAYVTVTVGNGIRTLSLDETSL